MISRLCYKIISEINVGACGPFRIDDPNCPDIEYYKNCAKIIENVDGIKSIFEK